QHLLLRGAERNLFERALGQEVATLIDLGDAAAQRADQGAEREHDRNRTQARDGWPDRPLIRSLVSTWIQNPSSPCIGSPCIDRAADLPRHRQDFNAPNPDTLLRS